MKRVIILLLVVGLLLTGACTITAEETEEADEINFSEPAGENPTPCGGGGGAGEGGAPG